MPKDALHRTVAARIREIAERKHMSLNKVADFAGISRSSLARILNVESSPALATLGKIAAALDVAVRDLLPSAK